MPATFDRVGTREGSVKPGTHSAPYLDGFENPGAETPDVEAPTGGFPIPTAPHESEPGHTYRLAQSLQRPSGTGSLSGGQESPGREPLPSDLTHVPVPDRVLDAVDELSGCAARLSLLMIRASYGWDEGIEAFRASPRWQTARQIEEEAGGLGMSRESLRRGAEELEARGWLAQRKRSGEATAYRWRLSVPKRRYTPVPAPLLHAHQGLSHSALVLLLSVVRATLGWAEREDGMVTYRRTATLSASTLERMTGLARPTLRDAQDELRAKSALYTQRKHRGAPYEFAVDFSFFRARLQNFYTPTYREKNSNNNTHAEESTPKNALTEGRSGGQDTRRRDQNRHRNAYRVTENWEEEAIRLLSAEPIGMNPEVARNLVIRRGKSVVEGAIRVFRRRSPDVETPAGWMHQAIKNLWFGPSIADKSPDVRQSGGEAPIAKAFEALTEKQEGWEWDPDADADADPGRSEAETPGRAGLDAEPTIGVGHAEMCDLIQALGSGISANDFETVEREGRDSLFVPSKELANWAYFRRDEGSDRFRQAAREVVTLRARHEGRPSPLG